MPEEWCWVPGHPNYQVSSEGRVKSFVRKTPRILKASPHSAGYLHVSLSTHSNQDKYLIHRLVCEAFHGLCPGPDYEVAHNNGNRRDNRASNLRWATKSDNQFDRESHGTSNSGSRHGQARLDEDSVREARDLFWSTSITKKALAEKYGVSESTMRSALSGRTWDHVTGPTA